MYKKRSITLLLIGILSGIGFILFAGFISPTAHFQVGTITISPAIPLLLLLFLCLLGLGGFVLRGVWQGTIIGLCAVSILVLRFFGFTNWFFTILTIIFFSICELIVLQKN